MRILKTLTTLFVLLAAPFQLSHAKSLPQSNAYDYSFHTLMGKKPLPLSAYQGKVILIVNTASHCGFTPQYAGLESLYQKYKDRGFVIIGVPSNDFGAQEPGDNEQIEKFCKLNFGVTFPMTSKEVVSGAKAHPFYLWASQELGFGSAPKWNFHKYLIDRKGKVVDYFYSTTKPDSPKIAEAIEKLL